jgi:hypothetical protein
LYKTEIIEEGYFFALEANLFNSAVAARAKIISNTIFDNSGNATVSIKG